MTTTHSSLAVTVGATFVTWLPQLDIIMRVGASFVAIVSGLLCAVVAYRKLRDGK